MSLDHKAICGTCNQTYGAHNGVKCPDSEHVFSSTKKFVDTGKFAAHSGYDTDRESKRVSKRDNMDEVCAGCNIRRGQHYTPSGRTVCPTPIFEFPRDDAIVRYFQWNGEYRDYDTDYRDRKKLYKPASPTVASIRLRPLRLHVANKLLLVETRHEPR